jgi:hypothetical protein
MNASTEIDISDEGLRAFWRQYGGEFHDPHLETATMPEAALFVLLRYLVTTVPIAKSPAGEITNAREAKSERDRFEDWMHRYKADHWPNPDADGSVTYPSGVYRNKSLHERWEAWQAALDPLEVAARAQRLEFAATALAVVERRRDELRIERDRTRDLLLKYRPQFVVLKGCQAGDVVFLTPSSDLSMEGATRLRQQFEDFTKNVGVRLVLLPPGFAVEAHHEDESTAGCIYSESNVNPK